MGAAPPNMHTVQTTLNYYLPPSKGGVAINYPGTASDKRREHQPRDVTITDIRGSEQQFSLDKQGFQVVKSASAEKHFDDDARVKSVYYPDCVELLKRVTSATRVEAASHIIRKRSWDEAVESEKHLKDTDIVNASSANSARYIHGDQSYFGAESRIRDYLPFEDVQKLTRTRWAIINVWRPIGHPASREPLALCDARSVRESDLLPTKAVLPQKDGSVNKSTYFKTTKGSSLELWALLPPDEGEEDRHKWYYCSDVDVDEAVLIKQFDSKRDGRARRVPHSAFASSEDHGPTRKSLEVRCFVFWEDQELE